MVQYAVIAVCRVTAKVGHLEGALEAFAGSAPRQGGLQHHQLLCVLAQHPVKLLLAPYEIHLPSLELHTPWCISTLAGDHQHNLPAKPAVMRPVWADTTWMSQPCALRAG